MRIVPFTGAAGPDGPRLEPAWSGSWRRCSGPCLGSEQQVCPLLPPHQNPLLVFVILGGDSERGHCPLKTSLQSAWRRWAPGDARKQGVSSLRCSRGPAHEPSAGKQPGCLVAAHWPLPENEGRNSPLWGIVGDEMIRFRQVFAGVSGKQYQQQ